MSPPTSEPQVSFFAMVPASLSSRRYPQVPEKPAATKPMAFDIWAVTGGNPTDTSTGKVTSVPEPTTELMVPAQNPANRTKSACHHSNPRISTGLLEWSRCEDTRGNGGRDCDSRVVLDGTTRTRV